MILVFDVVQFRYLSFPFFNSCLLSVTFLIPPLSFRSKSYFLDLCIQINRVVDASTAAPADHATGPTEDELHGNSAAECREVVIYSALMSWMATHPRSSVYSNYGWRHIFFFCLCVSAFRVYSFSCVCRLQRTLSRVP
jgi:hypothetical protein